MDPEDQHDLDHSQNLITSSFYHFGHILKILSKSIHRQVFELSCSQTIEQTDGRTDKPRRKHNLLGGGNNTSIG